MAKYSKKNFLGSGFAFPLQFTPARRMTLSEGEDDIQQAIRIILSTMPGERLMRPEFGCRAYELVFAPRNSFTENQVKGHVREALERWEPRIEIDDIVVEYPHDEAIMRVKIYYTIKVTHDKRNIVYPFYISGGFGSLSPIAG